MDEPIQGAGERRRWGRRRVAISLNTALELLLAVLLVGMVNYVSFRHYRRADWSRSHYYSLSDKTRNLLGSLTNRVRVVVFFQPQQEIYEDVDNLLKEYVYASPWIEVERVDPDRDLARTEELTRKYQVEQANVVVFESGGRTKYISSSDIIEFDYSMVPLGQEPVKTAFKGEQAFSSAIQSVTHGRRPRVYFLQGHGERDPDSFSQNGGYSGIGAEIRRDNIELSKLVLGEAAGVPEDADALGVAGPSKRTSEQEINLVRRYLTRRGRVMVLLDPMTASGLDPLLAEWGVRLAEDVVVDATRTLSGRELFVTKYNPHPITSRLGGVTSILYLPRSVEPAAAPEDAGAKADKPRVLRLASCSDAGWAETDLEQNPMRYDPQVDRPGPVSVAVAVETGAGLGIDMQIRPTRLVVFGDSDFVANGAMTGGNADFFMSALNWLLEREELMGIAAKPAEQNRLIMSHAELQVLFWVVVVLLPGFIAMYGSLVWLRRRS